jgi:hypothetical protein
VISADDYGVERPAGSEEVPGLGAVPRENNDDLRRPGQRERRKRRGPGAGGSARPAAVPHSAAQARQTGPEPKPPLADDSHVDYYA